MSPNVISLASRVHIVLLCGDECIAKPLADRLNRSGARVTLIGNPDLLFCDLEDVVESDALWVIVSGDDALRLGQFCRLLEVDNVISPHTWKLFWVGGDAPVGLSALTGVFPELPRVDQMIEASRGG